MKMTSYMVVSMFLVLGARQSIGQQTTELEPKRLGAPPHGTALPTQAYSAQPSLTYTATAPTVTCTAAPLQHLEIAPPAVYTAVPPLRVYQQIQPLRTYTAMAPIVSYTAVPLPTVRYAWHGSTLTLLNQSSAPALVRIIGPEGENVEVPARDSRKVNVVDGQYFVKIRFGTSEQNYTYSKGDSFSVTDTFTQSSELTLTFNSITGNYDTVGIPKEDFWK